MTVRDDARQRATTVDRQRTAAAPRIALPDAWWPVAFGHAVSDTPLPTTIAHTPLCLYRDGAGDVRAVLDVCPHRRLPLSMGRLTPGGDIQCGYHGWCFDGATGRCTAIPNLRADESVSPSIRVRVFSTAERIARGRGAPGPATTPVGPEDGPDDALALFPTTIADGFVHVWTGEGLEPPAHLGHESGGGRPPLCGELEARAPLSLVAEVLATAPGPALGLGPLLGAGEEVVRPSVDDDGDDADAVRVTRERRRLDLPRVATFEPRGRRTVLTTTTTSPVTGSTTIDAESDDGRTRARVVAALTPIGDYRTVVRWHAAVDGAGGRTLARAGAALGRRHAGRHLEHLADELSAGTIDLGVLRLRARRTTT